MNLTILLTLSAIGAIALVVVASNAYAKGLRARRQAIFLSRLADQEEQVDSIILGFRAARLSKIPFFQKLLHDAPFVGALSELLERSGLETTVMGLIGQMCVIPPLAYFGLSIFGIKGVPSALLALGCGGIPILAVHRARAARARAFELQLPQALELISLFLRSGRSLPQAFTGATDELQPPAAEEFITVAEEYRLGRPLDIALKRLAVKYPDSVGFRLFSIAVGVLGQTGGNLVEVLDRIKKSLDANVKYQLKLKSMTAESRMSGYILSALPGVFMGVIIVIKPDYAHAYLESKVGYGMIIVFLCLWVGGIIWIQRLMTKGASR